LLELNDGNMIESVLMKYIHAIQHVFHHRSLQNGMQLLRFDIAGLPRI
jgi:hypothetical protein